MSGCTFVWRLQDVVWLGAAILLLALYGLARFFTWLERRRLRSRR